MRSRTHRLIVFLSAFTAVAAARIADAQDTTALELRSSFGAIVAAGFDQHTGNFEQLPGVPNCGSVFTNGFGVNPSAGLFYRIPLKQELAVSLRAMYVGEGGTFNADEHFPLSVGGNGISATDRHSLSVSRNLVALQPVVEYDLLPSFDLFGGAQLGYVVGTSFQQKETMTSPVGATFIENGSSTRNVQSGSIPDANKIDLALVIGAAYALPLSESGALKARPQAYFSIGLTPVVQNVKWTTNAFTAGVAIEYTPPREVPKVIPTPPSAPPPPEPKRPVLIAKVRAVGLDGDTAEQPIVRLKVEEIYETQMAPLVPYIFFDEGSAELPSRYALRNSGDSTGFTASALFGLDRLDLYRHELDLIGSRLAARPDVTITLTGCNDGIGTEAGDRSLSMARAKQVAAYLEQSWNIAPSRMHLVARDLPEDYSPRTDTDGITENRRVEISSDDASLLAPVTASDTLRIPTPPSIRFYPSVVADVRTISWELTASQNRKVLRHIVGAGMPPVHLDWLLSDDQRNVPKAPGYLDYVLRVRDSSGGEASDTGRIPVEQRTIVKKRNEYAGDYEIERFSLILFDFNSAELTPSNKQIITFIKSRIRPKTEVTITGYCDRIGDPHLNQTLSEQRAQNTAKLLGIGNATIDGLGSSKLLFDNTLPEGRLYSRTVEVVLRTPVRVGGEP